MAESLISERQAAMRLGICPRSLRTWRVRGQVRFVRLGRQVRYDPADLDRYIESNKSGGQLPPTTDQAPQAAEGGGT
jgi:excisionase family DNA binding protein